MRLVLTLAVPLLPSVAGAEGRVALGLGMAGGWTPAVLIAAAAQAAATPRSALDEEVALEEGWEDAALDQPLIDEAPAQADGARGAPALGETLPDLSVLVAEPVRGVANSGFGWRDDPIRHHRRRFHRGADFRAPRGTPVYAAADGEVVFCGRRHGYGRSIDLRHGGGLLTRYAHLSRIEVDRGSRVGANAVIGRVGSTGRSTGPHLHFEVRVFGQAVDPDLAVRVGELQRLQAGPEAAELAALALRGPERRDRSRELTSDRPRPAAEARGAGSKRHLRRRPPRIS